ncbi:MAG: MauE/DoxX family redox-associated membrane protein [Pseudomonadota bacterium]
MAQKPDFKTRDENRGKSISDYWPLLSLILISAAAAWAILQGTGGTAAGWMHYFMGIFLTCFAMLKIFNLSAFADGFQMYDILGKRFRGYALAYPFIELGLGLAYLAFFVPYLTYVLTIIVMGIGTVGVIKALNAGLDINCPCMGSVLKVPLSTVTLTEDIGMGAMAAIMLVM